MKFIINLTGRDRTILDGTGDIYCTPKFLRKLIKLAYQYISLDDDIHRSGQGAYSPTLRDNAQDSRGSLLNMLVEILGKKTFLELISLGEYFSGTFLGNRCVYLAEQRAANDAEFVPWSSKDITTFGKLAEKSPQSHRELFDLTISKLLDIKYDLEEGDSSEASTWKKVIKETELRVMLGNRLRLISNGFYSVPQEEELADKKKPDFRIHHSSIDAPVPIELKIVDNGWTVQTLKERIRNQLIGQYLRDQRTSCGIFLLVYRGEKAHWIHPQTNIKLYFNDLLIELSHYTEELLLSTTSAEAVEIVGIDLTIREGRKIIV